VFTGRSGPKEAREAQRKHAEAARSWTTLVGSLVQLLETYGAMQPVFVRSIALRTINDLCGHWSQSLSKSNP